MNREQQRGSVWQGLNPPTPGVVLDKGHPRARGLLGFWWPSSRSFTGNSFARPNAAAIRFPDLSGYNRPAVFNRGPFAQQSLGAFVPTPHGPGFEIGSDGGQYGQFVVAPNASTDWDFSGAFTFMCRVSHSVLITADESQRVYTGRGDGAGPLNAKWYWGWTGIDVGKIGGGIIPASTFHFRTQQFGGPSEDAVATTTFAYEIDRFYTVAVTRSADKVHRFYVDGAQIGDAVTTTAAICVPITTDLSWGVGEDFGRNFLGTWSWMKAWNRALVPREVVAEHWSPWAMLRLPYGVMEASTITTVGTCPFL